jgi:hypothetical protein
VTQKNPASAGFFYARGCQDRGMDNFGSVSAFPWMVTGSFVRITLITLII